MWPLLKISGLESTSLIAKQCFIHAPFLSFFSLPSARPSVKWLWAGAVPTTCKLKPATKYVVLLVSLFWFIQTRNPRRWRTIPIFPGLRGVNRAHDFQSYHQESARHCGTISHPKLAGRSGCWPSRGSCQISVRKLAWVHDSKAIISNYCFLKSGSWQREDTSHAVCTPLTLSTIFHSSQS